MRALITGVAGQDGTLLSAALVNNGWEVFGTHLSSEVIPTSHSLYGGNLTVLDISDHDEVLKVVQEVAPDVIWHLAGITSVSFSIQNPELTFSVNVGGTQNLLTAVSKHAPESLFVHAASTEIYDAASGVITEQSLLAPRSPYAESKAMAYQAVIDSRANGLRTTNAVLSNHESYLRSTDFVTGKIANGVARIKLGLQDSLPLGNLDVEKDWSCAHDIVTGLIAIAEHEYVGDVILASGRSTSLLEILENAFTYVGIGNWQDYVKTESSLVRQGESKSIRVDPSHAASVLNWRAMTPTQEWVGQMVQHHLDALSSPL
jgi:GDPmannose 4,6-dehydratase